MRPQIRGFRAPPSGCGRIRAAVSWFCEGMRLMGGWALKVLLLPGFLIAVVTGAPDGVEDHKPPPAAITIDYPEDGAIFPPEITPPEFLWRDGGTGVTFWRIDVSFGDGAAALHAVSKGERPRIGRSIRTNSSDSSIWRRPISSPAGRQLRIIRASPHIALVAGLRSREGGQVSFQ